MLWLLLALALTIQTPPSVKAGQPFEVRVTGAETGVVQLACAGGQLRGTLTATTVNGTATFPDVRVLEPGAVQLVAVSGTSSTVSPLSVEGRTATFADRPVPYVGVELRAEDGQAVVETVRDGSPAQKAGLEEGETILSVDGRTGNLGAIAAALRAGTGPVTLQLKKGKTLTVVRETRPAPPLEFDYIPFQANLSPFQVRVFVADDGGQPLPGARVTLKLDPAYRSQSVLVFTTETILGDASGAAEPSGVTGEDGVATIWCRLYNATTPFDVQLTATATYGGRTSPPTTSNEFTVYRR